MSTFADEIGKEMIENLKRNVPINNQRIEVAKKVWTTPTLKVVATGTLTGNKTSRYYKARAILQWLTGIWVK